MFTKGLGTFSLTGFALVAAILVLSSSSVYAEDVDNDQGEVTYYTYTCNFAYEGTNAQTIQWDFGFNNADGTRATSTEWNPQGIVFPAKGKYTVTQTVSNTVGTYVSQIIVNIMGTPEITFDTCGGNEIEMQVVKVGGRITVPENPVREGYTFVGWYLDPDCAAEADLSVPVSTHMTYYAKWSNGSSDPEGGPDDPVRPEEPEKESLKDRMDPKVLAIGGAVSILGLVSLMVNLRRYPDDRSHLLFLIAAVSIAVGIGYVLTDMGILNLPGGE